MYKKIIGMFLAMFFMVSAAFAVDIDFDNIVASSSLPASITYTCVATDGVYLKMTVSTATATDKIHYAKNGVVAVSGDYASSGNSISVILANTDTLSLISSTTVDFAIITQKIDELSKNESLSRSISSSGSAILCDESNGIVVKLAVSSATATSVLHYKKNEYSAIADTSIAAGAFAIVYLSNDDVLSLISSETMSFTALTIPVTSAVATTTSLVVNLVASTVAFVSKEATTGVRFNFTTSAATSSFPMRYSTTDFATNTTGTIVGLGACVGFDLASGSIVTMFSSSATSLIVNSLVTSNSASQSTSATLYSGPAASVINFTGTEAASLQMVAVADVFLMKNASATVLSPTKIPAGATYSVDLFTSDYLSFVSPTVTTFVATGRVSGGASAPVIVNQRTLTPMFSSQNARTVTFRNKVPKRVFVTSASQTTFIGINAAASTTSSLKATPSAPFVSRLSANDYISTLATATQKTTIRSVPIGR
jgi:hypothetical protein